MTDAEKLRALADWFDIHDRRRIAESLEVTPAEVPDYMLTGKREVQLDLLRIADALEAQA